MKIIHRATDKESGDLEVFVWENGIVKVIGPGVHVRVKYIKNRIYVKGTGARKYRKQIESLYNTLLCLKKFRRLLR